MTCGHFDDNPASAAIIRKLGFVPTGERQADSASRGKSVRLLTYRLPNAADHAGTEFETARGVT